MNQKRLIDPPYPSFTLAMSQLEPYPLRLPAYRSTHLHRYHPYPRNAPIRVEPLMKTVDLRYVDDAQLSEEPTFNLQERREDLDESYGGDVAVDLHMALHSVTPSTSQPWKRIRLSTIVIDLALAVVRRCHRGVRTIIKLSPSKELDTLD